MNDAPQYSLCSGYNDECMKASVNTKLFGLQIDNHLNSHNHTARMVPKLGSADDAVTMLCISIIDILK
jgi:hypothetical protein